MNKTELIEKIAEGSGLTKTDSKKALEATLDAIKGALKSEDKVALIGFGTFGVGKRAERTGKNPRTGEAIKIAARKTVKFKAGAELSNSIN